MLYSQDDSNCEFRCSYIRWMYSTSIVTKPHRNISARVDLKEIGRRIREIRGFDLTQAEFGLILGLPQTQVSKYELGQSVPTVEILLKLRAYSEKSIDWILTGEEPKTG